MSKEKYSFLEMGSHELGPVRAQAAETALQMEVPVSKVAIRPKEDPPGEDG